MYKIGLLNRIKKTSFLNSKKKSVIKNSVYLIFEDLVLIYADIVNFFLILKNLNFSFFFSNKMVFKQTIFEPLFRFNKFFIILLGFTNLTSNINLLQYLSLNNTINYINSNNKRYKKFDIFNIRLKFLYLIYSNIIISNRYFLKFINFIIQYNVLSIINTIFIFFLFKLFINFIKNVNFKSNS